MKKLRFTTSSDLPKLMQLVIEQEFKPRCIQPHTLNFRHHKATHSFPEVT